MDRITYVKYNSTRKPEYRIATEIHEDGQEKWIVKRTRDVVAQKHLYQIVENRELLEKKLYKNISVLDVIKENGSLCFPFVIGKSLDEKISKIKLDKEEFIQQVNCLFDQIFDVQEGCKCTFEPTKDFYDHFGEICPVRGVPALCPANLDSLFSNFIETENGLVCLDYEWVYDFPIPVEFIKYRSIRYFYNEREKSMFSGISRDSVMEWFGIDSKKQDLYWSMESYFQQQIYGEDWRYIYLNRYKKAEVTLQMLDELIKRQNNIILYNEACIRDRNANIQTLESEIRNREKENLELKQINSEQEQIIEEWMSNYQVVINSISWRITKPLRNIGTFVRKIVKKQ